MTWRTLNSKRYKEAQYSECAVVQAAFSAYLDGAVTGIEMAAISRHLDACGMCTADFNMWREIQRSLDHLGPAKPPARLQARLLDVIAAERERGTHLSVSRRALLLWKASIAPLALRFSGGLAAAVMLAASLSWMFGPPFTVQANDDAMAQLIGPSYMYSQISPEPINTHRNVPIIVEAMVDSTGRVYDYSILEGPQDKQVKARVESNLLNCVFKPATAFGVPIRGHVLMTYTGISVRG